MKPDLILSIPFFLIGIFSFGNFTSASEKEITSIDSQDKKELLEYLMTGLEYQRELLKSGIFKVDGEINLEKDERRGLSGNISLKAECFFSNHFEKFRFDQSVTQISTNHRQQNETKTLTYDSKYVLTPEYSIHTEGDNTSVRINNPDYKPYGYFSPFDIRVVGLINDSELLHGMSRSGNKWFLPGVLNIYKKYTLDVIERVNEQVYKIAWLSGKNKEFKLVLWIDTAQGFSPTKMLVYIKRGTQKTFNVPPAIESEVTWTENNKIWVPVELKMKSKLNPKQIAMKFEWIEINTEVPDSTFTVEGFDLPVGRRIENDNGEKGIIETQVIDHRLGNKILIKGGDFIPDETPIQNKTQSESRITTWILVANSIFILFILALILRFRRS